MTYKDSFLTSGHASIAPLPLVTLLLALGLGVWGARSLYRYDPEPRASQPGDPVGIRGWLLLPALANIVGLFMSGYLVLAWLPFFDADTWYNVPTLVKEAHRAWAHPALLVIVGLGMVNCIASIIVAVLFFKKRTSAPRAYVALMWISGVFGVAVVFWGISSGLDNETSIANAAGTTIRELLVMAIWTAYMSSSRRVRATFVRRRALPVARATAEMLPVQ